MKQTLVDRIVRILNDQRIFHFTTINENDELTIIYIPRDIKGEPKPLYKIITNKTLIADLPFE